MTEIRDKRKLHEAQVLLERARAENVASNRAILSQNTTSPVDAGTDIFYAVLPIGGTVEKLTLFALSETPKEKGSITVTIRRGPVDSQTFTTPIEHGINHIGIGIPAGQGFLITVTTHNQLLSSAASILFRIDNRVDEKLKGY